MKTYVSLLISSVILFSAGSVYSQDNKFVAQVFGKNILMDEHIQKNPRMLFTRIISPVLEEFMVEQKITVSENEVEEYLEAAEKLRLDEVRQRKEQFHAIEVLLKKDDVSETEKRKLRAEKTMVTMLLKGEGATLSMDIERSVARQMILSWKMDVALFLRYGGRVIFQQMGAEPVDAYEYLLEKAQKDGKFMFFDKKLERKFWEYYHNDKLHVFIKGEDEAKEAIMKAWWKK